jgi:hypothetical protein
MMRVSMPGYDVIALIECLYYLSVEEQDALHARIASHHMGF